MFKTNSNIVETTEGGLKLPAKSILGSSFTKQNIGDKLLVGQSARGVEVFNGEFDKDEEARVFLVQEISTMLGDEVKNKFERMISDKLIWQTIKEVTGLHLMRCKEFVLFIEREVLYEGNTVLRKSKFEDLMSRFLQRELLITIKGISDFRKELEDSEQEKNFFEFLHFSSESYFQPATDDHVLSTNSCWDLRFVRCEHYKRQDRKYIPLRNPRAISKPISNAFMQVVFPIINLRCYS